MSNRETRIRFVLKPLAFLAGLAPLAVLAVWGVTGDLGANPVETINRFLGDWALRILLVSLAITPLARITGSATWVRFRRMAGLFAFFYAVLHLTSYVWIDQHFDWTAIWSDIVKRTYITVGMAALLLLIPLAVTSPKAMVKRLGGRRWRKLHRLVYPAAILVVVHYVLMTRADFLEPAIHGAVLAALLAWRLYDRRPPALRAGGNGGKTPRPTRRRVVA